MIKALFAQKVVGTGVVGPRLRRSLLWWKTALESNLSELRSWEDSQQSVCRILVDAASTPACCAAVLFCDGFTWYTAMEPSNELLEQLEVRGDKQITSLEIIAILLSLMTFGELIRGRKVVLYSDNKGAEGSTTKGSAKASDQNQLVHEIWTLALKLRIGLWIERVPSKDNLSDSPSRYEYDVLEMLRATWIWPKMPEIEL